MPHTPGCAGLPGESEILQLYACTDGQASQFDAFIRNLAQYDTQAGRVHQISQFELLSAPYWPDQGVAFLEWMLKECRATPGGTCTPVFVGHNIERCVLYVEAACMRRA